MRLFRKDEEAVSPVIGVILMVAITVILAAVIAAFVFGLGGSQTAAPTASIVAANNPDTQGADMKIQHKGGDMLKGGEWKLSIVKAGDPPIYKTSMPMNDFGVGNQIISMNKTDASLAAGESVNVTNTSVYFYNGATYTITAISSSQFATGTKYDVKLVHIPSNAMLLDQIVEVR